MKKVLALVAISALFTGCASTQHQSDPYENYLPWKPYSISKTGTVYLAEPGTKKQLAPGVYQIWTKDTDPNWKDIIIQQLVDCNSEETLLSKAVAFKDGVAMPPLKFEKSTFDKVIPGTIGYGLVRYICK